MRSRAQREVPLQPQPQWDIHQGTNINNKGEIDKGAARVYIEFKLKEVDMKERGASGYEDFWKPQVPEVMHLFSPTNIK